MLAVQYCCPLSYPLSILEQHSVGIVYIYNVQYMYIVEPKVDNLEPQILPVIVGYPLWEGFC